MSRLPESSLKTLSILCIALVFASLAARGQEILSKNISISVANSRIADVLKLISNKGNFYFSYKSTIIPRDSLVTLSVANQPVKEILDRLFNNTIEYRENNNYLVLRKIVPAAGSVTQSTPSGEKLYTITGYVLNAETGERINNVSIYEKQRLVAALTDNNGFFSIKLKSRYASTSLNVSRYSFEDTVVTIEPKYNQQLTIVLEPVQFDYSMVTISPLDYEKPDSIIIPAVIKDSVTIQPPVQETATQAEKTKVGKFLLSTKQRIQSLNLGQFFTGRPFQFSLIPGVSSRGKLSGQVINNFSFNVLGGYTGGVKGLEIGGLFNIVKQDVKYLQAAGLFNIAGGSAYGVQVAGINNTVLNPVIGFQMAGINNYVKGKYIGIQLAGVHNHVGDSVSGMQIAGVSNYARGKVAGLQLSGVANFSNRTMSGIQVSGVFNYAKHVKGLQLGLINIADTSEGYSIGLINFVLKGYHKIDLSANETFTANASFKSGNPKFYSILVASASTKNQEKAYGLGYGFGHEISLGKKFTLNPEVTAHMIYLGEIENRNIFGRLELQLNFKLFKNVTLHAGPAFAVYNSNQTAAVSGYKFPLYQPGIRTFKLWDNETVGWIGWSGGISLF